MWRLLIVLLILSGCATTPRPRTVTEVTPEVERFIANIPLGGFAIMPTGSLAVVRDETGYSIGEVGVSTREELETLIIDGKPLSEDQISKSIGMIKVEAPTYFMGADVRTAAQFIMNEYANFVSDVEAVRKAERQAKWNRGLAAAAAQWQMEQQYNAYSVPSQPIPTYVAPAPARVRAAPAAPAYQPPQQVNVYQPGKGYVGHGTITPGDPAQMDFYPRPTPKNQTTVLPRSRLADY